MSVWEQSHADVRLQSSMRGPGGWSQDPPASLSCPEPRAEVGKGHPRPSGGSNVS